MPKPQIPRSLTRDTTKQVLIDSNDRAKTLSSKEFLKYIEDPYLEPLFIETLGYDLILLDYGYSENIFKFAAEKYNIKNDPEVVQYLD